MQDIVKKFVSELHTSKLKQAGFKKKRHEFRRAREDYIEFFEIQGSAYNNSEEPWLFYINFAVDFPDIKNTGAMKHHAVGRIGDPEKGIAANYMLCEETYSRLFNEIPMLIEHASLKLPALLIPEVRQRAVKGLASVLPLPDWMKEFEKTAL
jgi:hypothetical protein